MHHASTNGGPDSFAYLRSSCGPLDDPLSASFHRLDGKSNWFSKIPTESSSDTRPYGYRREASSPSDELVATSTALQTGNSDNLPAWFFSCVQSDRIYNTERKAECWQALTMRSVFSLLLCALLGVVSAQQSRQVPRGFATTKNGQFLVDGKALNFVGANSYWLPLLTSKEDVDDTFRQMQGAGIKVLRTWGFNAINATELPGAIQSGLTYYQVWNSTEWTLNDGPQGLQRLDYVLETAGKYGIKVILAFTNNWVGYGGSELYINWIAGAGKTHDVFYSDPRIVASYQRYVRTIVNRYKSSPNIFAWELMNEARCLGDLPGGPNCVPGTELITRWYKQQSDFVRSLDPFHLITTGGEGHFYWKDKNVGYWLNGNFVSDYNFNGQAGEDFDADLQLANIDFGTYHLYPQFWYTELDTPGSNFTIKDWGLYWIQTHADAARKAGKPVILEEFGVSGLQNKTEIYPEWVGLALKTRHAGIMPWQFGALGLKENGGNRLIKYADALIDGASPNDGFAYYSNQTAVWNIFKNAARTQASRSG